MNDRRGWRGNAGYKHFRRASNTLWWDSQTCRQEHRVWLGLMYMLFCSPLQHGRGRRQHLRCARQEKWVEVQYTLLTHFTKLPSKIRTLWIGLSYRHLQQTTFPVCPHLFRLSSVFNNFFYSHIKNTHAFSAISAHCSIYLCIITPVVVSIFSFLFEVWVCKLFFFSVSQFSFHPLRSGCTLFRCRWRKSRFRGTSS